MIKNSDEAAEAVQSFLQNISSLPRYAEGGYSPLGRSAVVDTLLEDPLYMPVYAQTVADLIKNNEDLFPLATALQTASGIKAAEFDTSLPSSDAPLAFLQTFPTSSAKKLHSYWQSFMHIHESVENIMNVLSSEEKEWIKENYDRFFFGEERGDNYNFFTSDNPYPLKFYALASRIDFAKLNDAARQLNLIADDFYHSRKEFGRIDLDEDFIWEENGLKFLISNKTETFHREDADFFIDLGGSNTIHTNAGGTGGARSLALHIDLKGHNIYAGKNFVQGCGFLGVGLLFSCAGHNTYKAESYAQGCGFFGVGTLVNHWGQNRFDMEFAGQSFALFGSSLLLNYEGNNHYLANQGMGQAASSTLGSAFLIDRKGANVYISGVSGQTGTSRFGGIGQGGSTGVRSDPWLGNPSFYGGLSFLFIGRGHNHLKTVWLGQGSAYFLSAGIVVAEGSHDTFEADYDAQGQGLHLAAGLLLKKGSKCHFKGGWGSLGTSGDRSVGMFINMGSHNTYEGSVQCIGTSRKPKSLGVFINVGSHNTYTFQSLSNARLQFPDSPRSWPSALFLEIGDGSQYSTNTDEMERGEDRQWGIAGHSLGISTKFLSPNFVETLFTPQPFPFKPLSYQPLNDEILTVDYDQRRQIYEALDLRRFQDRSFDPDLSHLLKDNVPEDAFNYGIMWALRNREKVDLKSLLSLTRLTEYSRKLAVTLIGTFATPETASFLTKVMHEDPSEEIRYFAALALTKYLPDYETLAHGTKSDSELVRYAIAKGLQESDHSFGLNLVVPLFTDESFYVRRAAGLTALSLGDKSGVSVVLETLQYETLDTEENYGNNIYNQLSDYLGVDFGIDKAAWINWWKQAKDDFSY